MEISYEGEWVTGTTIELMEVRVGGGETTLFLRAAKIIVDSE